MQAESRKIMNIPDLRLSATCVRVPVAVGHSEALHIEFERPMSPGEARELLSSAPGIEIVDDPLDGRLPSADRRGRARSGLRRADSGRRVAPWRHRPLVRGRQPAQGCRVERGPDRRATVRRGACRSRRPGKTAAADDGSLERLARPDSAGDTAHSGVWRVWNDGLWTRTHRDGHPVRRAGRR